MKKNNKLREYPYLLHTLILPLMFEHRYQSCLICYKA